MRYLPLFIVIILVIILMKGLSLHPNMIPSPLVNKKTPQFILPSLADSNEMITDHDFLNHITLLNVWASWCYACANEHEFLLELAKNKNIVLYGFNYKDDLNNAKKWLIDSGNPYKRVIVDQTGETAIDWGVYGTPETFLIDQKGVIRYKIIGPLNEDIWQKKLLPLIQKIQEEER